MTVADAQARMTEAEFVDWLLWFEHRAEMTERHRKGLPLHDTDAADEASPEESATNVHHIMAQLQQRRKG